MNLKKTLLLLLTLILMVGVCFTAVSCSVAPSGECTNHTDSDGDGICDTEGCNEAVTTPDDESTDYFNENGELILFKGGVPTFNFVYASDASSTIGSKLGALADELNELSSGGIGAYLETNKDYKAQAVEIIAGTITTRGVEYKFDKHTFGSNGYMVKQIGTKIVIVGGSNDALTTAFNYLKNEVFGITRNTPPFTDLVMQASKNQEKIITNYKLTDVKIGENSIRDYTLVASDKTSKALRDNMQKTLYEKAGIWVEVKSGSEPIADTKCIVIRLVDNDGESDGFEIKLDGDDLIIECMYPLLFEEEFNKVYEEILNTRGTARFNTVTKHLRTIYYEDYADKTGKVNAIDGLIECHNYANVNGHKVKALRTGEGTFLINKTNGRYATVKTDTDWTGATFIIDDSGIGPSDKAEYGYHIFYIKSENSLKSYSADSEATAGIGKFLYDLNQNGGIDKDTFNSELEFNLGLGRDALVYLYNDNHRNYVRYGPNADNGAIQKEFIYLKANGAVDDSTPLLYDYNEVTRIEVLFIDDTPITISGGTFNTIANRLPRNYAYYTRRGIEITRSNTTLTGLTHLIEGEGENGAPYNGFITISGTNNVTLKDSVLTAHKAYGLESDASNVMGTYDLSPSSCNNTLILNVTQTNFLIKDSSNNDVPSVNNGYWGIMGGNDCKNLTYDGCRLTRFDSHRGTLNATIIRSEVALISVIGGGTLRIEDSKVYMTTGGSRNLISLRDDYGSTWNGELIVKDVEVITHHAYAYTDFHIVSGVWRNNEYASHDFGYDCYSPYKVTIDNFSVNSSKVKNIYVIAGSIATPDGTSYNTYHKTEVIDIYNNTKNYTYYPGHDSAKLTVHPIAE